MFVCLKYFFSVISCTYYMDFYKIFLGVYSTCVVKKKKGWTNYNHCDKVLSKIYGKDVCCIIVRKRSVVDGD